MKWNERVHISEVLQNNPDLFWMLMHIGWGSLYGAITLATVIVVLAGARQLKEDNSKRIFLLVIQTVWSVTTLCGVFAIPLLFSLIYKQVLIDGAYVGYWLASWGFSCVIYYLCLRKLRVSFT